MASYKARCIYGVFEKDAIIHVDRRLKYQPNAQAGVNIYHNGDSTSYVLMSYETLAAKFNVPIIKRNEPYWEAFYVFCDWSRTTLRHIQSFIKEYVPRGDISSELIHYMSRNNVYLNTFTGDIVDDLTDEVRFNMKDVKFTSRYVRDKYTNAIICVR